MTLEPSTLALHMKRRHGHAVDGDLNEQERFIEMALQTAEQVDKEENKSWLLKNINAVSTGEIPV